MAKTTVFCHKHPEQELICPVCRGSKGGRTTAKRHSKKKLAQWGKMGGRPRKHPLPDAPVPQPEAKSHE